jgi:hypothetical protein
MSDTVLSGRLSPSPLLRGILQLDCVASGAMGILLLGASSFLAAPLGLPQALLTGAGIICLGWACFLAFLASRTRLATAFVWTVIALNAVWVLESISILLLGWVTPTTFGYAVVIVQAIAVGAFAELQFIGLKRSQRDTALPA